jgi:hypothetical protein
MASERGMAGRKETSVWEDYARGIHVRSIIIAEMHVGSVDQVIAVQIDQHVVEKRAPVDGCRVVSRPIRRIVARHVKTRRGISPVIKIHLCIHVGIGVNRGVLQIL